MTTATILAILTGALFVLVATACGVAAQLIVIARNAIQRRRNDRRAAAAVKRLREMEAREVEESAASFVEPVPGPTDVPWRYEVGRTRARMIAEELGYGD